MERSLYCKGYKPQQNPTRHENGWGVIIDNCNLSKSFAQFFDPKVKNIVASCKIEDCRIVERHFSEVVKILKPTLTSLKH